LAKTGTAVALEALISACSEVARDVPRRITSLSHTASLTVRPSWPERCGGVAKGALRDLPVLQKKSKPDGTVDDESLQEWRWPHPRNRDSRRLGSHRGFRVKFFASTVFSQSLPGYRAGKSSWITTTDLPPPLRPGHRFPRLAQRRAIPRRHRRPRPSAHPRRRRQDPHAHLPRRLPAGPGRASVRDSPAHRHQQGTRRGTRRRPRHDQGLILPPKKTASAPNGAPQRAPFWFTTTPPAPGPG
jgi:hypothetical protein